MDMRDYIPATKAEADVALLPTIENFQMLNPDAELVVDHFYSYHTSYNHLQAITDTTAGSDGTQPRILLGYKP